MKILSLIPAFLAAIALPVCGAAQNGSGADAKGVTAAAPPEFSGSNPFIVPTDQEPIAPGRFQPTWESLEQQYQVPEWLRDAEFGIWAHWGPQCEPEDGDWYARNMYMEGSRQYKDHLAKYGPPYHPPRR